jgi:hypothetical protein
MRLSLRTFSALAFAASITIAAHADTFTFKVTGAVTASGIITAVADPSMAGVFDVTAITGTYDGQQISLLPCAAYDESNPCFNPIQHTSFANSFSFDNLLYYSAGQTFVDFDGIGFSVGSAGDESSFFYYSASNGTDFTPGYNYFDNSNSFGSVNLTVASTPEPGSFVLLGTGLVSAFATLKRKRFSNV